MTDERAPTTLAQPAEFPLIVRVPGVMGGEPVIKGTRVAVWVLAAQAQSGTFIEELCEGYPHVSEEAIREALQYYDSHRDKVDRVIQLNEDVAYSG